MINKIKNRPAWYQLWAISVAVSAIYFLVVFLFFEISSTDRLIEAYALVSLLIDFVVFPKERRSLAN